MYVGITQKSLKERFRSNGLGYKSCSHFWYAIQKYGWNNFDHEVIASHLTEEEACNMEKLLIKELNLTDQNVGYNISEGGNKGCLLTGERHPRYGKRNTPEANEKNRLAHIGKHSKMSDEARSKISKSMLGNKNMFMRKVMCVETNIIYESAAEASRQTGVDSSAIIKCLNGKLHTTHNLHWQYVA